MFPIPFHVFPFISINFIEKSARPSSRGMLQFYSGYAKNPKPSFLALTFIPGQPWFWGLTRKEEEAEMV